MKKAMQTLKINEQVKFDINNYKDISLDSFTEMLVVKNRGNESRSTINLKVVNGLIKK